MGNELITEHDERIRSYFQALERLSKALETLFSKRKSSLDGESFYTDEELSQRLKISRRSLQDYRNQGRTAGSGRSTRGRRRKPGKEKTQKDGRPMRQASTEWHFF